MTISHIGHIVYPYLLQNLVNTATDQLWAMDNHVHLNGKTISYRSSRTDIISSKILLGVISNTRDTSFCVELSKEARRFVGVAGIINTDQDSQFSSCVLVAPVAT
jgi:putative transposase